jgi:hypothetical protein
MKRLVSLTVLFLLAAGPTLAQQEGFGVGILLGEPTSVNVKGWLTSREAIDGGLAWSLRDAGYLRLYVDYLWHFHDVFRTSDALVPYLGAGGTFGDRPGSGYIGVRLVGGLIWYPQNTPLDVFAEAAPVVDLAPETLLRMNGGIGIRFYFR